MCAAGSPLIGQNLLREKLVRHCRFGLCLAVTACLLLIGCRIAGINRSPDEQLAQIRSTSYAVTPNTAQAISLAPTPAPQYYRSALLPLYSGMPGSRTVEPYLENPIDQPKVDLPDQPKVDLQDQPLATSQPRLAEPPPVEPDGKFYGIDFSPGSPQITLRIELANRKLNHSQPLEIRFLPGSQCLFGDGQACVNMYLTPEGQPVIYLTVHSGVGGQAQDFRDLVEGTGFNSAGYALKSVQANLKALAGAKISLLQGQKIRRKLDLAAVGRVPAQGLAHYFEVPIDQALKLAGQYDPALEGYSHPDRPLLVFETCGWKMPGETRPPGTSATSSSVYIGVVQRPP